MPIFSLLCFYSSTSLHALVPNTFTKVQTLKILVGLWISSSTSDGCLFPCQKYSQIKQWLLTTMVDGGAWKIGDKNHAAVVKNKLSYWTKQNWIFVSINYRLVPDATNTQTQDIGAVDSVCSRLFNLSNTYC